MIFGKRRYPTAAASHSADTDPTSLDNEAATPLGSTASAVGLRGVAGFLMRALGAQVREIRGQVDEVLETREEILRRQIVRRYKKRNEVVEQTQLRLEERATNGSLADLRTDYRKPTSIEDGLAALERQHRPSN
jgi:hypothetical protein